MKDKEIINKFCKSKDDEKAPGNVLMGSSSNDISDQEINLIKDQKIDVLKYMKEDSVPA